MMQLLLDWWRWPSHWPKQLRIHLVWSSPPGRYWECPIPWPPPKHSTAPVNVTYMRRLLSLCKIALKHNFISCLLVITGAVMALHYTTLTRVYAGCPVVVCLGPAETGNSTVIKAALSLFGMYFFLIQNLTMLTQCDLCFGQQDRNCQPCMWRAQMPSSLSEQQSLLSPFPLTTLLE